MKNCVRYLLYLLTACLFSACNLDEPLEPFIKGQTALGHTDKAITAFSVMDTVTNIRYTGVVNEAASPKTVTINVPFGTTLTSMTTAITHTGASISPAPGTQAFTNGLPVPYTVTAADGTTAAYDVTVNFTGTPGNAAITAFSVSETPAGLKYWGNINGTNYTIVVTVPSSVSLNNMTAAVSHTGASVASDTEPQPADPTLPTVTFTGADFTNPVTYTVTAADGTTQPYTVSVIREGTAPPPPPGSWAAYRSAGNGGLGEFYGTLAEALTAAPAGTAANPDTIILVDNDSIASTITTSGKHIRLTSPFSQTITRTSSNGALINVGTGGSLELGGDLVIDGGSANGTPLTATAALITVNGTLKLGGSAVLRNNNNSTITGGGVYVAAGGIFTLSDSAQITGNQASHSSNGNGGGVYVAAGGTFTMSGGSITGNNASNGGGVYANGAGFTMSGNANISSNTAVNGGGVYVPPGGIFTMSGGTIGGPNPGSGNSADYGGGIYITGSSSNTSYFIKTGGTIDTNTASNDGTGIFAKVSEGSSESAKGSLTSSQTGTITVDGNNVTIYGL